jgi:general secretion pathway protein I
MMPMMRHAGEAGFTLLEVMVAFIIAALACIVLYRAGFSGAAEAVTAARYQEAVVRAQSHLAAIGPLMQLQSEDLSGDDGGGFHWQIHIAAGPGAGTLTLYDVQVTERFGTRAVTLATKRLGPST